MIVTVTPNPSLDLTYTLPPASPDVPPEVIRAEGVSFEASGKGVNVTRTLLRSGVPSRCVIPLGGGVGDLVRSLLEQDGVPARVVARDGETRINTSLLAPDRLPVKVNSAGGAVRPGDAGELLAAVRAELTGPASDGPPQERWLAVCGSLPPGCDPDLVGRLVQVARDCGWRSAVDTHGAALAEAVAARAGLLAPNVAELAEVEPEVRAALAEGTVDDLVAATCRFAARSGCEVLLSRGADGALWTDGRLAVLGRPEPVQPVNPAGAGDALLAGWLSGRGATPAELQARLARAVAWGTACCQAPTTVADLGAVGVSAVRTWVRGEADAC